MFKTRLLSGILLVIIALITVITGGSLLDVYKRQLLYRPGSQRYGKKFTVKLYFTFRGKRRSMESIVKETEFFWQKIMI